MLPGGVGAREVVMKAMLEPTYGELMSTLAPVIHRLVIIASELIIAPLLYAYHMRHDLRH